MPANKLFYSLCCDIISLTSLKITQAFHLLLGYAEIQAIFWDFKIRNSVRITEGSDNGESDNRGPTVYIYIYIYTIVKPYIKGVDRCIFTLIQLKPVVR